jgi:hypothetical protein
MNHRHLLPDEVDLLVDDEVGFGVAPLKAHMRDCADCHARVAEARRVVDTLERLPHFAPSHRFTDRVMAQVPVFVPWHVAARDSVLRWLPRSRPARVAVAALATSAASVLTLAILWVTTQTDLLVVASGAAGSQVRNAAYQAASQLLSLVLGDQALHVLQPMGGLGIAVALTGLVAAATASAVGLRALAVASSHRRA